MNLPQQIEILIDLTQSLTASFVAYGRVVLINTNNFHSPVGYLEVVETLATSDGEIKLQYWDPSGKGAWVDVSGSLFSWSGDGRKRATSSFSFLSGGWEYRIAARYIAPANQSTLAAIRLVIVDSADTISKTEAQYELGDKHDDSGTDWRKAGGIFKYDSAKNDGSITHYFEAYFATSKKTGEFALWDLTVDALVANSTVSTTSDDPVRVRSSAITLVDGHEYVPVWRNTDGYTVNRRGASIIQIQTGLTKTRIMLHLGYVDFCKGDTCSAPSPKHQDKDNLYDEGDYPAVNAVYHEVTIAESPIGGVPEVIPYTAYSALTNLSTGNMVTGSSVSTTSANYVRKRTSNIKGNMQNGVDYDQRIWNSNVNKLVDIASGWILLDVEMVTVAVLRTVGDGLVYVVN